jgi:hypothetical protein
MEIDSEDMNFWEMRAEIGPNNYTSDVLRRQKTALEEGKDEDNIGERRLLVARVYLSLMDFYGRIII